MRPIALLLAGALALAACGGGKPRSDADQVRDTLGAFTQASAEHDYKRVCGDLLAKPVLDAVRKAGLSCEQTMKAAMDGVKDPKLEVRQVTVDGTKATAKVHTSATGQQPSDDTVALVKEGGDWKIGSLAGG